MRWRTLVAVLIAATSVAVMAVACGDSSPSQPTVPTFAPQSTTTVVGGVTTTVAGAVTTVPGQTTIPTVTEPSTTTPSSTTTTTNPPSEDFIETRVIGESVEGRPIVGVRRGERDGLVVLIIGAIHGNEDDGMAVVDKLAAMPVPSGLDLWLVDTMNPDGVVAQTRFNANQVDLNRNFPYGWGVIGVPGDSQYSGTGPASEPETQAMVEFITDIQPDMVIWYHQDLFRIAPARGRDGRIRQHYAELTGLPYEAITGGTYTGVAATWARNTLDGGVAFIVELGPTLSDDEAQMHADAVFTVATEDLPE